jgi:hypothetical protein
MPRVLPTCAIAVYLLQTEALERTLVLSTCTPDDVAAKLTQCAQRLNELVSILSKQEGLIRVAENSEKSLNSTLPSAHE